MKKMYILGLLVLAVIVTAFSVSGTYAKYTTEIDKPTDSAFVAIWDFQKTDVNVSLFTNNYNNGTFDYVDGRDSAKVVAPGTTGEYKITIKGNAETAYVLSVEANDDYKNDVVYNDTANNVKYSPLMFKVSIQGDELGSNAIEYWSYDLQDAIDKMNDDLAAITIEPSGQEDTYTLDINWYWAFDLEEQATILGIDLKKADGVTAKTAAELTSEIEAMNLVPTTVTGVKVVSDNSYDTKLGNAAYTALATSRATGSEVYDVTLSMTISATQVK